MRQTALRLGEDELLEAVCTLSQLGKFRGWGKAYLTSERILWEKSPNTLIRWTINLLFAGPAVLDIPLESIVKVSEHDYWIWGSVLYVRTQESRYWMKLSRGIFFGPSEKAAKKWCTEISARLHLRTSQAGVQV
jgi:hypothetical protein